MLDTNNARMKSFCITIDRFNDGSIADIQRRLITTRNRDGHLYNIPIVSEVAGITVGDLNEDNYERKVIVHKKKDYKKCHIYI